MDSKALIGTWTLESWAVVDSTGAVDDPFGEKPVGYIMYGPEGYMAVGFMPPDRKPSGAADILRGTPEEKCAAIETYIAYARRYEVAGDRVRHHIALSLFPNWTGVTQELIVHLDGDTRRISSAAAHQGQSADRAPGMEASATRLEGGCDRSCWRSLRREGSRCGDAEASGFTRWAASCAGLLTRVLTG